MSHSLTVLIASWGERTAIAMLHGAPVSWDPVLESSTPETGNSQSLESDWCVTCLGDEWAQEHGWSHFNVATGDRSCCHARQCDSCLSRFTCAECGE